jgi:hypothetical protein
MIEMEVDLAVQTKIILFIEKLQFINYIIK